MKLRQMKCIKIALLVFTSVLFTTIINAQTPADDPGIGGPGTLGSAPAGDGAPIVPYDGNMTLLLVASGIAFTSTKLKRGFVVCNNK